MIFSVEEIEQFDRCLLKASCQEIFGFILSGAILLIMILALLFLPNKYLTGNRYSGLPENPKKSRYRNGKKRSHQELSEERLFNRQQRKRRNKIIRLCASAVLLCLSLLVMFFAYRHIEDLQLDMETDAYVVYEGEFTCEYHHSKNSSYYTFTFVDDVGKTVVLTGNDADYYGMDEGTYVGRLVYGQNSEYLIEMELQ